MSKSDETAHKNEKRIL